MKTLQNLMHGYAATFGSPTCCLNPELLASFPQAKLLLHIRSSDEEWYKSFSSSIGLDFESGTWRARIYRFLTFSIGWVHPHHRLCDHMAEYWREQCGDIRAKMRSAHNRRMKELMPEKLLVYDVKEGWGPLCNFLDVPFPRVNDSKQMQRNYLFLQVYGAAMWMLYGGESLCFRSGNERFAGENLKFQLVVASASTIQAFSMTSARLLPGR